MKVEQSDFESLDEFPLKWRWTDAKWNLLAVGDLEKIRPLTSVKAAEIHDRSIGFLENNGISKFGFIDRDRIQTSIETESISRWLDTKCEEHEQDVFVSWDRRNAVIVDWCTFSRFWSDFCYPSSDDVAIFPLGLEWILFYSHDEYFEFGRRSANFLCKLLNETSGSANLSMTEDL